VKNPHNKPLIFALIFFFGCGTPKENYPNTQRKKKPQQIIKNFIVDNISEAGTGWQLVAPRAEMYEDTKELMIATPEIQFFERGEKGSNLKAGKGIVFTDTNDVRMWEDVVIVSTSGVRLSSDCVYYSFKSDIVKSTAPVEIVRPGSVTNGIGWESKPDLSEVTITKHHIVKDN